MAEIRPPTRSCFSEGSSIELTVSSEGKKICRLAAIKFLIHRPPIASDIDAPTASMVPSQYMIAKERVFWSEKKDL